MDMAKKKGFKGDEEELRNNIVLTYRQKRAQILADEEMKKYETT
jgi:hypothetical protein